jgi:hypothetical protein
MTEYSLEITAVGDPPYWPCDIPLSAKVGTNFADKRRLLGGIVHSRTKAAELVSPWLNANIAIGCKWRNVSSGIVNFKKDQRATVKGILSEKSKKKDIQTLLQNSYS